MSRDEFAAAYSGYALVISDPSAPSQEVGNLTQVNGTTEQTSNEIDANSTNVQADNSKNLTNEEMQNIKGKHRTLILKYVTWWEFGYYESGWGLHRHWLFPTSRPLYYDHWGPLHYFGWHKHGEWRFV